MGSEREPDEGQEVRGVREDEGADLEEVHGDDPRVCVCRSPQVADRVEEEGDPYLPINSLKRQATTLLVYGKRVGGPIGNLLEIAGQAITIAVMMYERTYGPFENGSAPSYELMGSDLPPKAPGNVSLEDQ